MQEPQPPAPIPPPPRRSRLKLVAVIVAVVVVAIIVVAYLWVVWYPSTLQPRVTLTDALYSTSGCGVFGPYYLTYTWTFNLTNTGTANGFATVSFWVNNIDRGSVDYYIPMGTAVAKSASVDGGTQSRWPCGAESPGLVITQVTKA